MALFLYGSQDKVPVIRHAINLELKYRTEKGVNSRLVRGGV